MHTLASPAMQSVVNKGAAWTFVVFIQKPGNPGDAAKHRL